MKAVILAGGLGTRLSEETALRPKPMVEIGGMPILWHILKIYSHYGINEFIICCGYKGYIIKEYFANYFMHQSDITFDMANNEMHVHQKRAEPWKVTLVDTGLNTMTGGRIKRVRDYIGDEDFMLTYGDGLSNVDLKALLDFHKKHKRIGTMTTVNIGQAKGVISLSEDGSIKSFREKSDNDGAIINGGFMVMSSKIFDFIDGDETIFEQEPLQALVDRGELMSFYHDGFWQCMDTQREKNKLEELWNSKKAPWKIWK